MPARCWATTWTRSSRRHRCPVPGSSPSGRARPRRIRARRVLRATGETSLKGFDTIDLAALRHGADVHRPPAENAWRTRRWGSCASALQGPNPVWERLSRNPAEARQTAAAQERLRQPCRRSTSPRRSPASASACQEGRDLAPDRAHGRPDKPDELGGFFDDSVAGLGATSTSTASWRSSSRAAPCSCTPTAACATASCRPSHLRREVHPHDADLVRADGLGWAFGRAAGRTASCTA